jgi:hypothetical protein
MNLLVKASMLRMAVALTCVVVLSHAADEKKVEGQSLPGATEVLERYAKAIGGKENFKKHNSQHALGTVQMKAQGVSGKMEVFAARPNKLLMKMTIQGVGEFNTGFDGKVAWMSSQLTGPMLLEGKMREQIATQADFDHALHDPADYTKLETLGVENFNGEDCYKLKLVHRTGFESTEYFSKATGLQRGFVSTQESPLGPVTATTLVTDYKQFGELLMPSRISQKAAGVETVMTMDEMEFNKVDASVFELPPDVKELASQPAQAPEELKERPATKSPASPGVGEKGGEKKSEK